MENLRKQTKVKLIVMLLSMLLPLVVIIVMAVGEYTGKYQLTEHTIFAVFQPLPYILCVVLEAYLGYKNYRYVKILKDDDYANYFLIKKNDERNKMIRLQANALVHKIMVYFLGIALIFTAFARTEYFIMCATISGAFLIIHLCVSYYYHKKY